MPVGGAATTIAIALPSPALTLLSMVKKNSGPANFDKILPVNSMIDGEHKPELGQMFILSDNVFELLVQYLSPWVGYAAAPHRCAATPSSGRCRCANT
jgi:hypothetical protein